MAGSTIPDRVAQIYYTYGLFCSSYPICAITIALSAVLLCCYPLLNVPLPGNIPTVVKVPMPSSAQMIHPQEKSVNNENCKSTNCSYIEEPINVKYLLNETVKLPYMWAKERPHLYVQQIIMKTGVYPWNTNLRMWDAYRGPLHEAFRILETIRNHEDPEKKTTLARHCYQIDGIKRNDMKPNLERVLPEYSCLILSPANLWQQHLPTYALDNNLISTIFNYQNLHRGKVSIAEMAFGMNLKDAGIKRYPLRSRSRVLQFAVTIFYDQIDDLFVNSLIDKLRYLYPLHQGEQHKVDEATLIYYPGKFNYFELIPLTITFIGLFIYIYFSVRKIEYIKSKLGLAACAVLTIGGSLSMSMGLCFYFGFSLSLQGKEIFPYLVIIVGLENVLVLTKSVTSTDSRLDVKIRLAQGLSKEGWSITKNLLTEITIFTAGLFTFVPFIQEFSIFMIVSLVSDYFIQMIFFATILGIDVRRMEYFQEDNNKLNLKNYFNSNNVFNWNFNKQHTEENSTSSQGMKKSKSHPRLNGLAQSIPTDVVAKRKDNSVTLDNKVPKRIRLVNMWARTRFFQRAFMIWMLVWLSMIVYNSGIVDYFVSGVENTEIKKETRKHYDRREHKEVFSYINDNKTIIFPPLRNLHDKEPLGSNESSLLKHTQHLRPWTRLSPYHWSTILSQYNESLSEKFIVVLPPQLFSCRVSPELAISIRNPEEKDPPTLRWQALAAALDPIDISPEFDLDGISHPWNIKAMSASELPIYPTTPMEILLLAILCTISVIVIAYMMMVLYRCICSRNYAEWRASWTEKDEYSKNMAQQPAVQLVMEAVPLVVTGHSHEVECMVTDGEKIISSCLQGTIKVWNSENGELLLKIDRQGYFKLQKDIQEKLQFNKRKIEKETIEYNNSPDIVNIPRSTDNVPRLRKQWNSHLRNLKFTPNPIDEKIKLSTAENTRYDLAKSYREFYCSSQLHDQYNIRDTKSNKFRNSLGDVKYNETDDDVSTDTNSQVNLNSDNLLKNKCKDEGCIDNDKHVKENVIDCVTNLDWKETVLSESPVWCMDYCSDLIILGCADGRLEFWEMTSTKLMCVWWITQGERCSRGATQVRALNGARYVVVATLGGHLMMLRLDAYNTTSGIHVDWSFSTAHRRTHKRTGSAGSVYMTHGHNNDDNIPLDWRHQPNRNLSSLAYNIGAKDVNTEEIHCTRIAHCRAHLQPITEMHIDGGRILTGGQDHVLKVFSSTDLTQLFTLHGHCGPITSSFIDHATPTIGGSGSQDGLLCVWDLHTGACLYSIQAHDGAVTSLAYTASYVISAGTDERLCIWDRFQGHMLNSIVIGLNYMSRMLPLTHTLLLMGDRSGLTVYDLSNGDVIRRVLFGHNDGCIFVRQILPLKGAIVCDYANQLRIVRFPLVSKLANMKNE